MHSEWHTFHWNSCDHCPFLVNYILGVRLCGKLWLLLLAIKTVSPMQIIQSFFSIILYKLHKINGIGQWLHEILCFRNGLGPEWSWVVQWCFAPISWILRLVRSLCMTATEALEVTCQFSSIIPVAVLRHSNLPTQSFQWQSSITPCVIVPLQTQCTDAG